VSGVSTICNIFCTSNFTVNSQKTCDGNPLQPTFIYGIPNGVENGFYAYWNSSSATGPGNNGLYRVAQIITEPSGPNAGLYGRVIGLFECGNVGGQVTCVTL
jgi:hypothetical protein